MTDYLRILKQSVSTQGLFSRAYDKRLFVIRPPQRRFKWKNEQIEQLWNDILTAHIAERDSYFLGTLLLVPLDDGLRFSVIDGQQRITTLSILLAILRDRCLEYDDLKHRAFEFQKLISPVDNDGRPVGDLVVTLQEPDNQTYRTLVREHYSTLSPISGDDRIEKAVISLSKNLMDYLEPHSDKDREDVLRDLCEYIQENVSFLPVVVPNESEGYLVFDTANTRGMDLRPYEALKARLTTMAVRKFGHSDLSEELCGMKRQEN